MGSPWHSPQTGTDNCRSSAPSATRSRPSGDMWKPPDLEPPGSVPYRATRVVRSKNAAPYNGRAGQIRPRMGSHVTHSLRTPRLRNLQDPLTGAQCWSSWPHDAMGKSVNKLRLPRHNDGFSCTPLHYASKCDRAAPPDRGRAPLTGRAILQAEATQGRTRGSATNGGTGTD